MKKRLIFPIVFILAMISCKTDNTTPGRFNEVTPVDFARIDSLLDEYILDHKIQGAVALVAHKGRVVYHHAAGYRNIEKGQPQEVRDIFRIASMTKQITSVAAMILYDQGKFQLEDPLGKYIPGFDNMQILDKVDMLDSTFTGHSAEKEITIRQLFTHSSGIGYGFQDEKLMALIEKAGITEGFELGKILLDDNIKKLADIPLIHEPGLRFTYGLNMDVLGRLVEIWSGQKLDVFFQENIFEPLGMEDTHFYLPGDKYARLADVYMSTDSGIVISDYPYDYPIKGEKTYLSGGADLSSTAYDYFLFCQMMLNGGELGGVRILKQETAALMSKTHLETGDYDMGLGFSVLSDKSVINDARSIGSYSGGGYFGTSYWIDPKKDMIAVLMLQIYPFENYGIYNRFENIVYDWSD